MKTKYLLGISMLAMCSVALTSCDDDETYDIVGNPNNLVYVNIAGEIPEGMPKNTFAYSIYHTPAGSLVGSTPGDVEFEVMCTKNASTDIQVTLEVDPTLAVDGYATLPSNAGIMATLESTTLTIPSGSNISSSKVKVNIDDSNANWDVLTEPYYLLPIKIKSSSSGLPSEQMGCAYIGFATSVKEGMVNTESNNVTGTQITDKAGWSGIYKVTQTGIENACPAALFDGNTSRAAYQVKNHAAGSRDEVVTTIDLGKVYTLSSVRFDYYREAYSISTGTLETSVNGTEWEEQGTRTWSSGTRQAVFSFWAPFSVRYVRLTSTSFSDATNSGQYMTEFQAFE